MENSEIIQLLKNRFDGNINPLEGSFDILTLKADSSIIHDLIAFLKDDPMLQYRFLTTLCGIHYPGEALPLGVIYHLHNLKENRKIRIKTFVSVENPTVKSVTDIFAAAGWMERETYDFYGIIFEGHPNLKRILNVDYMDYFPMRKEYPLEDSTREDKDDSFFGR